MGAFWQEVPPSLLLSSPPQAVLRTNREALVTPDCRPLVLHPVERTSRESQFDPVLSS